LPNGQASLRTRFDNTVTALEGPESHQRDRLAIEIDFADLYGSFQHENFNGTLRG
jgi:hypothetical protein